MRTRAQRRYTDYCKAVRKKKLSDYYGIDFNEHTGNITVHSWYDNLHEYSKNKVHCSCGMCSRYNKTNNKSPKKRKIHGNYAPSYNPRHSEKQSNESLKEQIKEYIGEE